MHANVISVFGIVYLLFLFLGHLSAQITVGLSTFNPGMIDINPEAGTEHSWQTNLNFRRVWMERQKKNNQTRSDNKPRQSSDGRPLHNRLFEEEPVPKST